MQGVKHGKSHVPQIAARFRQAGRHLAHVEAVVPKWVKGCDEPIQDRMAELIVRAPVLMKPLEDFVQHADHEPENLSDDLTKLAQVARRIISEVSK
jgi:hypothetical protein